MKKLFEISSPGIPKGIIGGYYIEIYSGEETVLTGDITVEELGNSVLRAKINEHGISFFGENLRIDDFSSGGIKILGKIERIELN